MWISPLLGYCSKRSPRHLTKRLAN
ncbi:hypothetical protein CMUS01_06521 [Colletotrichum musicola]|uniref:Uncharacterized protein n=1 Tax=Colletotrichum musicola TaxID=2175873 RepID=A0A8H6NHE9_9PEZI|nr:hypothetical protein CMUS01_06521 [Colletotrichum musicola]